MNLREFSYLRKGIVFSCPSLSTNPSSSQTSSWYGFLRLANGRRLMAPNAFLFIQDASGSAGMRIFYYNCWWWVVSFQFSFLRIFIYWFVRDRCFVGFLPQLKGYRKWELSLIDWTNLPTHWRESSGGKVGLWCHADVTHLFLSWIWANCLCTVLYIHILKLI